MTKLSRLLFGFLAFSLVGCWNVSAQTAFLNCSLAATPPVVRAEGLAERLGDIGLNCTGGQPNSHVTGDITVFLGIPITNRINQANATDVVLTTDNGTGPQPAGVPGVLQGSGSIAFQGVSFNLSPNGSVSLRIANLRANVTQLLGRNNASVTALLAFNPALILQVPSSQVTIGYPARGLYAGFSGKIVCSPRGSPLPDSLTSFAAFLASNAVFTSTRVTEGFADAFNPRSAPANVNADSGQRIIIRYSGFPQGARLFVPDVVTGSDAIQPTAGGDFGLPASGGKYAPGNNGSLLLARVRFTDGNGAGGFLAYSPGASGSGTVSFDSIGEVTLSSGSGAAVYEVVDANPSVQESAQFPTFLGLQASGTLSPIQTAEEVSFAPVSNVGAASSTDPIPRFAPLSAPADCSIVGDCGASYFPVLYVDTTPQRFSAQSGAGNQVGYFIVNNRGGGVLNWIATVSYTSGSGWLQLSPASGLNNGTIRVDAVPKNLAPGTYSALITVDAGPMAGAQTVPVTFVVTAATPPPLQAPAITSVVNAASFVAGPVVPGSLTTIMGTKFAGKNVSVTFDGLPPQILFDNDSQINLLVPDGISGKSTAQVIVTVDGVASAPQTVSVAPFAPAIFKGAILNQDYSVNGPEHPAAPGSVIQIYATGLSGNGTITAQLGGRTIGSPFYAGPAPGFPGVQQVNILLPSDLMGTSANVVLCGASICGPPANLSLASR